jgi:GGDEF domain-containing protein
MAEKLGELLIRKNLLTQAQLEEALQAQVIFGGKLGTVLIEMGLITEDTLAEILAQLISIPCAKPGQLQNIPEDVIKIISAELAEKHKVIPVSVSGKKLTLATDPGSRSPPGLCTGKLLRHQAHHALYRSAEAGTRRAEPDPRFRDCGRSD